MFASWSSVFFVDISFLYWDCLGIEGFTNKPSSNPGKDGVFQDP